MADTAVHLLDHVFPSVPVRQWVLSLPRRLRYHLARRGKLRREVVAVFIGEIARWMRRRIGRRGAKHGSVTCTQRHGGSLNLNVHAHVLMMDGLFVPGAVGDRPVFLPVPPPQEYELFEILKRIHERVRDLLVRREVIDWKDTEVDVISEEESPSPMDQIRAASIQGMLAFGESDWVGRIGRDPRAPFAPTVRGGAVEYDGFSLHAGVRIEADDREGLEKLCRYILRPPFSKDRFESLPDGRIAYRMKHAWNDGTTHVVFRPEELLERLASLVPAPREHLVLYHGVLGPNARLRPQVVAGCPEGPTRQKRKLGRCSLRWADLMKRVFKIDVLSCPKCGGRMKYIATIGPDQPEAIDGILQSMGFETEMPRRWPARDPPEELVLDLWEIDWQGEPPEKPQEEGESEEVHEDHDWS